MANLFKCRLPYRNDSYIQMPFSFRYFAILETGCMLVTSKVPSWTDLLAEKLVHLQLPWHNTFACKTTLRYPSSKSEPVKLQGCTHGCVYRMSGTEEHQVQDSPPDSLSHCHSHSPAAGYGAVAVARWRIFPEGLARKTRFSNVLGHNRSKVSGSFAESAGFRTYFSRSCPASMSKIMRVAR